MTTTIEDELAVATPTLRAIAWQRTRASGRLCETTDAEQQARIHYWQARTREPDKGAAYGWGAARRAAREAANGALPFGATPNRGHWDSHKRASTGLHASDGSLMIDAEDPVATDAFVEVESRGIRAEIASALSRLSPRDRALVVAHFFDGIAWTELSAAHGMPRHWASRRWLDAIRPRLAAELAHLRQETIGA